MTGGAGQGGAGQGGAGAAFRVFVTHTAEALALQVSARAQARLALHAEVRRNETGRVLSGRELAEAAAGCDLIVADRQTAIDAAFFEAAPDVLAVLRTAVDIRNIDLAAADAAGVLVTRSIPTFAASVAELALGLMIDGARGISPAVAAYRQGVEPAPAMGRELAGETLGIAGFGVIGRRLAGYAQALGMRVIVNDPAPADLPEGVEAVSFDALLEAAGFVICLVPATEATRGMFGAGAFARMRRDAMFLNLARGELVDEAALAKALDAGEIACAAMDVGSGADQRPALALAGRPDVLATPHIGGQTPQASEGQALHVAGQIEALAAGRLPPGAVNADAASRLWNLKRIGKARDASN